MIQRYKQFVKTNEEFIEAPILGTEQSPSKPERGIETVPGRPDINPSTRPSRPSVVPSKRPSEEDAPLASSDEYIGVTKMKELQAALPDSKVEDGTLYYKDKEINFYSETEKFHIGRQKFDDIEDVLKFLKVDKRDYDIEMDPEFEAMNYKSRRSKRIL